MDSQRDKRSAFGPGPSHQSARTTRSPLSAVAVIGLALALLTGLVACTGDDASPDQRTGSTGEAGGAEPHVGLTATVQQQRLDVGTRRIGLELMADERTTVHVSAVQLLTDAFAQRPSTPKDTDFAPGRIIDLVVLYGDPVCRSDVSPDDAEVRVEYEVDGSEGTLTLPVDRHGIGVLARLRYQFCAEQRLDRAASLTYQVPFSRQRLDGRTTLVGDLLLRRPADGGSGQPVRIRALLGSVLFDLGPAPDATPSWGQLVRGQDAVHVPIQLLAGRLCTAHGRSQPQQPFIFSAYVRVGNAPEYRQIIQPPRSLQRQALAYLDDVCEKSDQRDF